MSLIQRSSVAVHLQRQLDLVSGEVPMETLFQFDNLRLEKQGKQAWVTFTRESQLNAVNNDGTTQLNRVAMAIREDPDLRLVMLKKAKGFIGKNGIPDGSEHKRSETKKGSISIFCQLSAFLSSSGSSGAMPPTFWH